ncbi:MAG: SDR family NAD(P)-dependent oxidoreductase, partial [Parvibaculum sp.]
MELANKTLIVTGASSGIGAAAARLFASEGANVVLAARRSGELQSIAEDITRCGGSVAYCAGDVLDQDYAGALTELALQRFGSLHGAFNNAGVVGDMLAVPEMPFDNWNRVISTNLTSAFWAAK